MGVSSLVEMCAWLLSCGGVVLLSHCVQILSQFAVTVPFDMRQGTRGSS